MTDSVVTRVLVIDPSFLFYQGVSQALAGTAFQIIAWAQDQETALTERFENAIDLALIGHGFSPRVGLELCRALCAQQLHLKIILINEHAASDLFRQDAFLAGADACLASSVSPADFLAACHAIISSNSMRGNISSPKLPRLTLREIEILKLVAQDRSDKEIAQVLHVSVNTVRNHIQNILRKLEVKNRQAAVWRARHHGLI
jgi:DNA-binding NarL/FixJ family response regulator